MSDAHRATLSSTYTSDTSGLTAVDAKVQADTTCGQAVADGRTVVTDYRVYLLLVPQTHLVAASDTGTYAAGPAVRRRAQGPGRDRRADRPAGEGDRAGQARRHDRAAWTPPRAHCSGVADAMLALKPADIPAQLATIDGYRAKVASAHPDLRQAIADAKALKPCSATRCPARRRAPPPPHPQLTPPSRWSLARARKGSGSDHPPAMSLAHSFSLGCCTEGRMLRRRYGMTVTASRTAAAGASCEHACRLLTSRTPVVRVPGTHHVEDARTEPPPPWQWSTRITAGTSDGSSRSVRARPARQASAPG